MSEQDTIITCKIGIFTFIHKKKEGTLTDPEGNAVRLTAKENGLLKMLYDASEKGSGILMRKIALETLWWDAHYFAGRSMDVYIVKLRKYLRADSDIEIINIHGRGFRLLVKLNASIIRSDDYAIAGKTISLDPTPTQNI